MPKVSVIIPAYNRADILPRTINSVLNQTFKDFELIVIDDGSKDNTGEVVRRMAETDPRIKYIYQANSGGAAHPKNRAFLVSSGEFIAYLDHDDEWLPTKLEKQLKFFEDSFDKNLGLVSCNVMIVNNSNKNSGGIHKMHKFNSIRDLLLEGGNYAFSNSSIMVPRAVIEKVGPRDESLKLFEDQDIFVRIAAAGYRFDFVDEVLINYYIDDENLSKDFTKAAPDYERFVAKHLKLLSQYPDILAIHYRHLGTMNFLAGKSQEARQYFLKSLKTDFTWRNLFTAACSLFGKNIYLSILNAKKRRALSAY